VRELYHGLPACLGPRRQDDVSTGRSSGFRLVTSPQRPSPEAVDDRFGVAMGWGFWPITAAALRRIRTGFPFHRTRSREWNLSRVGLSYTMGIANASRRGDSD